MFAHHQKETVPDSSSPTLRSELPYFQRSTKHAIAAACLVMTACMPSLAQTKDCADEPGGAAVANCFEARYQAADRELNRVYASALKELSEGERSKLIEAQRAWLKYRDASLAFMMETTKDSRSYGSLLFGDYRAKVVEKRVQELKYILASPAAPAVHW